MMKRVTKYSMGNCSWGRDKFASAFLDQSLHKFPSIHNRQCVVINDIVFKIPTISIILSCEPLQIRCGHIRLIVFGNTPIKGVNSIHQIPSTFRIFFIASPLVRHSFWTTATFSLPLNATSSQ